MNKMVRFLLAVYVCVQVGVMVGMMRWVSQLQAQVESQQMQIETYRTMVFNLYGKDGG